MDQMTTPKISTIRGVTHIEGGCATVSEALKIGKLDWTVEKAPIYNGFMEPIDGFSRIVRSDMPNHSMHICRDTYQPISNAMVFGVLDQILGESHAQVERVGSTHGGNVCFIQAKMPDSIEVLKGDGMNCYLNAITSHDGSQLARVFFSSIRIACTNQIRASIRHRSERAISIRHTKNAEIKLSIAGNLIMEGAQEWQIIKENAAIMAAKSVNRLQTKAFVEALFPAPTKEDGRDVNKAKREGVYELIENGLGTDIAGVKGSAWGLFSAATEYFDHHSSTKGETSHFARSLLSGDKFRDQVLELAMAV